MKKFRLLGAIGLQRTGRVCYKSARHLGKHCPRTVRRREDHPEDMYRLGELTDSQRVRFGASLLVLGTLALAAGVIVVHYAGLPAEEFVDGEFVPVTVDYFNWIPRGWVPKALGYLVVFGASQAMLAGAALLWVLNQPMTWARAAFASFLTWIEFVIIFGIVPSEWLNLAQTDLDWSPQRIAVTIPPWLVLGNEIQLSFAALMDMVSGTYNLVLLVGAAVFAYKIQDVGKPRPAAAQSEPKRSPYGRPLVKGGE